MPRDSFMLVRGETELEPRTRVVVPYLSGINGVPMRALPRFEQVVDARATPPRLMTRRRIAPGFRVPAPFGVRLQLKSLDQNGRVQVIHHNAFHPLSNESAIVPRPLHACTAPRGGSRHVYASRHLLRTATQCVHSNHETQMGTVGRSWYLRRRHG